MKFSTRQDIDAPVGLVFRTLTDFDHWERAAMRSGASVVRFADHAVLAAGMEWQVDFAYRGKPRKFRLRLEGQTPDERLFFTGRSPAIEGDLQIDLLDMGARRTRMTMALTVRPRTFAARLFLQSLKLAKGRIDARFEARAAELAAQIEARGRRTMQR